MSNPKCLKSCLLNELLGVGNPFSFHLRTQRTDRSIDPKQSRFFLLIRIFSSLLGGDKWLILLNFVPWNFHSASPCFTCVLALPALLNNTQTPQIFKFKDEVEAIFFYIRYSWVGTCISGCAATTNMKAASICDILVENWNL